MFLSRLQMSQERLSTSTSGPASKVRVKAIDLCFEDLPFWVTVPEDLRVVEAASDSMREQIRARGRCNPLRWLGSWETASLLTGSEQIGIFDGDFLDP